jgi:hypothetical protein
LTTEERKELIELRRRHPVLEMGVEILEARLGLLRSGERAPKMSYAFMCG